MCGLNLLRDPAHAEKCENAWFRSLPLKTKIKSTLDRNLRSRWTSPMYDDILEISQRHSRTLFVSVKIEEVANFPRFAPPRDPGNRLLPWRGVFVRREGRGRGGREISNAASSNLHPSVRSLKNLEVSSSSLFLRMDVTRNRFPNTAVES